MRWTNALFISMATAAFAAGCNPRIDVSSAAEYCEDDGDCADGLKCNDKNVCAAECVRNADCDGDDECVDGACTDPVDRPACEGDGDCSGDDTCVDGECVAPFDLCETDRDCAEGQTCDDNGVCQPPLPECSDEGDCDAGESCTGGRCIPDGGGGGADRTCKVTADAPGTAAIIGIDIAYDTFAGCSESDLCRVDLASQQDTRSNVNTAEFDVVIPAEDDGFRFSVRFRQSGSPDRFSYEGANGGTFGNVTVECEGDEIEPLVTVVQWNGGPSTDAIVTDQAACQAQAEDLGGELTCD